jgi:hypothetical protein
MSATTIERPDTLAERRALLAAVEQHRSKKPKPVGSTATVEEARSAAAWFVLMRVSSQIRVGRIEEAVRREGDRPAWAFPLALGFPDVGMLGSVGEVLVDATTGEIVDEETTRARIKADARELVLRTAP